jgi:ribonuclease HI
MEAQKSMPRIAIKKQKYYVVWKGRQPGVFASWEECQAQIAGYQGAQFKSFESRAEAEDAFQGRYEDYVTAYGPRPATKQRRSDAGDPIRPSYAVDAACSGNPGPVEYRCVRTDTGEDVFRRGPFERSTNNIGEFLAVVDALVLCKKQAVTWPVYTDSHNAITWVEARRCKTNLQPDERNAELFDLIRGAEAWLRENEYENQVLKWDTGAWGEIPADFGRK